MDLKKPETIYSGYVYDIYRRRCGTGSEIHRTVHALWSINIVTFGQDWEEGVGGTWLFNIHIHGTEQFSGLSAAKWRSQKSECYEFYSLSYKENISLKNKRIWVQYKIEFWSVTDDSGGNWPHFSESIIRTISDSIIDSELIFIL